MDIRVRRVYDEPAPDDGLRVLADRLWPRGMRRDELRLDAWWKELTPSNELRRWYHGDRSRWPEFRQRYLDELDALPDETVSAALASIGGLGRDAGQGAEDPGVEAGKPHRAGRLTLLSAARDLERSHLPVLREWLLDRWAAQR